MLAKLYHRTAFVSNFDDIDYSQDFNINSKFTIVRQKIRLVEKDFILAISYNNEQESITGKKTLGMECTSRHDLPQHADTLSMKT